MLDLKDQEVVDDQADASVQHEQGKLKITMHQIVKKVPQLMLLAAMTIITIDPDTYGNVPGHTG